jgi:hypothetical protein
MLESEGVRDRVENVGRAAFYAEFDRCLTVALKQALKHK